MRTAFASLRQVHGPAAAWALVALAALLPLLPALVPLLMIVSVAALVIKHRIWRNSGSRATAGDRAMWFPLLLYALYVIGLAWSDNFKYGFFDLQIKLPLALFPLIFLRLPKDAREGGDVLLISFIAGNVLAVLACCIMVPVHALSAGGDWSAAVFGNDFSLFLHPSYFATYLCFALAGTLLLQPVLAFRSVLHFAVVIMLCLGTVLCGSKAGWACLPVVLFAVLIMRWKDRPLRHMVVALLASSILGVALLTAASVNVWQRVYEAWHAVASPKDHADATTSSEERKLVWDGAFDVISKNLPWGTGTGDVKDELVATYARKGYERLVKLRLNAHDQYLQTMATLGWPGILLLVAMLVLPLVALARMRDALGLIFFLLNAINWTVESMLEVQAGVVFFAFFLFVLAIRGSRSLPNDTAKPNELA